MEARRDAGRPQAHDFLSLTGTTAPLRLMERGVTRVLSGVTFTGAGTSVGLSLASRPARRQGWHEGGLEELRSPMSADLLCRGEVSPRGGGLESCASGLRKPRQPGLHYGPGGEEPREAKRRAVVAGIDLVNRTEVQWAPGPGRYLGYYLSS